MSKAMIVENKVFLTVFDFIRLIFHFKAQIEELLFYLLVDNKNSWLRIFDCFLKKFIETFC